MLQARFDGNCNDGQTWTATTLLCAEDDKGKLSCDDQHNLGFQTDAYKGKAHIVTMSPDHFLSVSAPLHSPGAETLDRLESLIQSCKPVDTPFLTVDLEKCKVKSHEGRHRSTAAKRTRTNKIPVIIYHDPIQSKKEMACLRTKNFLREG